MVDKNTRKEKKCDFNDVSEIKTFVEALINSTGNIGDDLSGILERNTPQ